MQPQSPYLYSVHQQVTKNEIFIQPKTIPLSLKATFRKKANNNNTKLHVHALDSTKLLPAQHLAMDETHLPPAPDIPQCSGGAVVEHHGLSSPRMEPGTEPTAPQALLAADRQS